MANPANPAPPDNTPAKKEPLYKTFEIYRWVCCALKLSHPLHYFKSPKCQYLRFAPLVIESRYASRKAYSSRIQGRLECLWPNGVGRSHQDQK